MHYLLWRRSGDWRNPRKRPIQTCKKLAAVCDAMSEGRFE